MPTYREWNRFSQFWKFGDGVDPDASRSTPTGPTPSARSTRPTTGCGRSSPSTSSPSWPTGPTWSTRWCPTTRPTPSAWSSTTAGTRRCGATTSRLVTVADQARSRQTGIDHRRPATTSSTCWCSPPASRPTRCCGRSRSPGPRRRRRHRPARRGARGLPRHRRRPTARTCSSPPGPNGILGHGGNGMFFAECHVRYIVECLRALFDRGATSMTVRDEVLRAFVDDLCARAAQLRAEPDGVRQLVPGRPRTGSRRSRRSRCWSSGRTAARPPREAYAFG